MSTPQLESKRPQALVLLAEGAEEMEVVIVVDVLRRAQVEVTVAGVDSIRAVTCSRGVRILPDTSLEEVASEPYDVVVLPGGLAGAERLASSPEVGRLLQSQYEQGRWLAAICAAPLALAAHGLMKGHPATCHPSVGERLQKHFELRSDRVVKSSGLITSRGPGTAFEFALQLVEELRGDERRRMVAEPMVL